MYAPFTLINAITAGGISDRYNKHSIFMQYTGIKDKNDIDIYEGDVIEFIQTHEDGSGNTLHLGVVTWEDGSLYSKSIKNEISRGMGGMSKNCTREVIGNIYENPELIKGEITN